MRGNIYKQGNGWIVKFPIGRGKPIRKWFRKKDHAERFLNGLRFKWDERTLDARDYQSDNPLGFANLVDKFLESKRLLKGVKKYEQRLAFANMRWGNSNVKNIGFSEIDELITSLRERGYSSKYIKDIRDCIKAFYRWLCQAGEITHEQIPRFPVVKASSPYRKIVDKSTQCAVLGEIYNISWFHNPRIYIGILFLATYINLRPKELVSIKEKDIDLDSRRILIGETKTGEPKYVYLLKEDVELLKGLPPAFPHLPFFRHIKGRGGVAPGSQFGKDYLYSWWKRACRNLSITGVDLYGGTRHSSQVALRANNSPEAIRRASMSKTKEAHDRYLQIQGDELRQLYAQTRVDQVLTISEHKGKRQAIDNTK